MRIYRRNSCVCCGTGWCCSVKNLHGLGNFLLIEKRESMNQSNECVHCGTGWCRSVKNLYAMIISTCKLKKGSPKQCNPSVCCEIVEKTDWCRSEKNLHSLENPSLIEKREIRGVHVFTEEQVGVVNLKTYMVWEISR